MSEAKPKEKKPIQVMRERMGGMSDGMKEYYRRQTQIRKTLREAFGSGPATIPQLAQRTGLNSPEVVWNVIAMKKYGQVLEGELSGDFYTYSLSGEE